MTRRALIPLRTGQSRTEGVAKRIATIPGSVAEPSAGRTSSRFETGRSASGSVNSKLVAPGEPAGNIGKASCWVLLIGPGCMAVGFSLPPALKLLRRVSSAFVPPSLKPVSIDGALPGSGGPCEVDALLPEPVVVIIPGELRR